jgi:cation diffusion facilitator CzcD-associated flavoprotein CzcO
MLGRAAPAGGRNRADYRPRHIVFANGVNTTPVLLDLRGLKEFRGAVRHSGGYGSGLDWQGKRALVLGTGTSGHDVAQDLCVSGAAEVTLIQRRPTLVVSLKEAQAPYALFSLSRLSALTPAHHSCEPRSGLGAAGRG